MTIEEFTGKFAELFEETDPAEITAQTRFHELDEWSSLMALSTIAMVDDEFDVALRGADMKAAQTVEDLYNTIISKI